MLFNKNEVRKVNDKKTLHKSGKNWIVLSSALLLAIAGGAAVANQTSANADANNNGVNAETSAEVQSLEAEGKYASASGQSSSASSSASAKVPVKPNVQYSGEPDVANNNASAASYRADALFDKANTAYYGNIVNSYVNSLNAEFPSQTTSLKSAYTAASAKASNETSLAGSYKATTQTSQYSNEISDRAKKANQTPSEFVDSVGYNTLNSLSGYLPETQRMGKAVSEDSVVNSYASLIDNINNDSALSGEYAAKGRVAEASSNVARDYYNNAMTVASEVNSASAANETSLNNNKAYSVEVSADEQIAEGNSAIDADFVNSAANAAGFSYTSSAVSSAISLLATGYTKNSDAVKPGVNFNGIGAANNAGVFFEATNQSGRPKAVHYALNDRNLVRVVSDTATQQHYAEGRSALNSNIAAESTAEKSLNNTSASASYAVVSAGNTLTSVSSAANIAIFLGNDPQLGEILGSNATRPAIAADIAAKLAKSAEANVRNGNTEGIRAYANSMANDNNIKPLRGDQANIINAILNGFVNNGSADYNNVSSAASLITSYANNSGKNTNPASVKAYRIASIIASGDSALKSIGDPNTETVASGNSSTDSSNASSYATEAAIDKVLASADASLETISNTGALTVSSANASNDNKSAAASSAVAAVDSVLAANSSAGGNNPNDSLNGASYGSHSVSAGIDSVLADVDAKLSANHIPANSILKTNTGMDYLYIGDITTNSEFVSAGDYNIASNNAKLYSELANANARDNYGTPIAVSAGNYNTDSTTAANTANPANVRSLASVQASVDLFLQNTGDTATELSLKGSNGVAAADSMVAVEEGIIASADETMNAISNGNINAGNAAIVSADSTTSAKQAYNVKSAETSADSVMNSTGTTVAYNSVTSGSAGDLSLSAKVDSVQASADSAIGNISNGANDHIAASSLITANSSASKSVASEKAASVMATIDGALSAVGDSDVETIASGNYSADSSTASAEFAVPATAPKAGQNQAQYASSLISVIRGAGLNPALANEAINILGSIRNTSAPATSANFSDNNTTGVLGKALSALNAAAAEVTAPHAAGGTSVNSLINSSNAPQYIKNIAIDIAANPNALNDINHAFRTVPAPRDTNNYNTNKSNANAYIAHVLAALGSDSQAKDIINNVKPNVGYDTVNDFRDAVLYGTPSNPEGHYLLNANSYADVSPDIKNALGAANYDMVNGIDTPNGSSAESATVSDINSAANKAASDYSTESSASASYAKANDANVTIASQYANYYSNLASSDSNVAQNAKNSMSNFYDIHAGQAFASANSAYNSAVSAEPNDEDLAHGYGINVLHHKPEYITFLKTARIHNDPNFANSKVIGKVNKGVIGLHVDGIGFDPAGHSRYVVNYKGVKGYVTANPYFVEDTYLTPGQSYTVTFHKNAMVHTNLDFSGKTVGKVNRGDVVSGVAVRADNAYLGITRLQLTSGKFKGDYVTTNDAFLTVNSSANGNAYNNSDKGLNSAGADNMWWNTNDITKNK